MPTTEPNTADYMPMIRRIALGWWTSYLAKSRNAGKLCYDDFESAAQWGIVKARAKWRNDIPSCRVKGCTIKPGNIDCEHGYTACVFATIAMSYASGECKHLIRSTKRQSNVSAQYRKESVKPGCSRARRLTSSAYSDEEVAYENCTTIAVPQPYDNNTPGILVSRAAAALDISDVMALLDDIARLAEGHVPRNFDQTMAVLRKLRTEAKKDNE